KIAKYTKNLKFNGYKIDGWKCPNCKEEYYNPEKAQKILLLNKLKKQKFHLKLSRIRSNLILRIPKEVSDALNLHKGENVEFSLKDCNEMVIQPITANKK
ncbi:MAG: AbrB/MazE/SpoVT family DNA-binding domain-containing protein, partial [Nanoarchaeota archaeon]|nr:AbrB/MazE/SpoVT family DNA-binding domain-containing protein [Nanoarchaeota archaeon]